VDTSKVLLVGSVPLKPAAAVFETACDCLGDLLARVPDGEQAGWTESVRLVVGNNPSLEPGSRSRIGTVSMFSRDIQLYRLKPGATAADLTFGDLGIATNALASYEAFRALKAKGSIPKSMRFQATIPGPATVVANVELPEEEALPPAERALAAEIDRIVRGIPADDLAIQLDLAVEVEKVEFERRPAAFDTPIFALRRFTMDGTASCVARLAARVPDGVELGFHLCALWHVYKDAGQDLQVQVDYANRLFELTGRQIDYIHLPSTPGFTASDFAPLKQLRRPAETRLFLGLLHREDGLEGAARRIGAARTAIDDFGISHFCGLGQWLAGPETVKPMLDLHRQSAALLA
jgi:hypothetical protein